MINSVKKGVQQLKENRFLIGLSFLILLIGQYTIDSQRRPSFWPKTYILLAVVVILLVGLLLSTNRMDKIAKNTFILIFLLGSLNSLILPIRRNLDENTHYYRVLQLSDGKVRSQTDEQNFLMVSPDFLGVTKLPSKGEAGSTTSTNLYTKDFLDLFNMKADYKLAYLNQGELNSPAYIPSAIGVKLGQLISNKVYISYYLGRIFNVLFYALLAFWAVKLSKYYQLQLFVMSLLPFVTWIVSGYNYDSLYYGLALLIMAQFTNFIGQEKSFTLKRGIIYNLTCLGLVFCKAPVILLIFLPVFLPKRVFATVKTYWLNLLVIVGVGISGLIWLGQARVFKLLNISYTQTIQVANEIAPKVSRISYFISHPFETIEMVLRSLFDIPSAILGSLLNPQPFLTASRVVSLINIVTFVVLLILISCQLTIQLTKATKIAFWVIFLLISLAIMYAISGDPRVFKVGDLHVGGVQGRYHYYLLVALPLLLSSSIKKLFSFGESSVLSTVDNQRIVDTTVKIVAFVTILNTCVSLYAYF